MNVIEKTKQIINDYENIKEFTNNVCFDFTSDSPDENFGLSSLGDNLVSKDILGNEKRQHNFVLYALNQAFNDYDRLANSTFLLELNYYLEKQKNILIDNGKIISIIANNGMLYSIPTGDINDGIMYQLNIQVEYIKESEE